MSRSRVPNPDRLVIVGRGSAAFETIVALVDRLPVMVAPRWLSTPTQPIALDDMIRYLVGVGGSTVCAHLRG